MHFSLLFHYFLILLLLPLSLATYPVAVFHGIGDTCSRMSSYITFISNRLKVHVECIESGGGFTDLSTSILTQSKVACDSININSNFQSDFSVVGFSQGGLIARYIIQKCKTVGRVRKFVAVGTPNMGVSKVPQCFNGIICHFLKKLTEVFVYSSFAQNKIGPSGYYRDNVDTNKYIENSNFLAELNNEKNFDDISLAKFKELEIVSLIKFKADSMIYPKETAWFQYVDKYDNVLELQDTSFYKEDFIGLKYLDKNGRVKFFEAKRDHLNMDDDEEENFLFKILE